ncbi:hypothetical protein [Nonomuraea sp. NPDC050643]|uniref:hypothetical protein n=1 Tax=Nonomuraea sp. NPDC050643 TaxID=3155660 RepID=UPI0034065FCD
MVVAVLRNGTVALVALDGDSYLLPEGTHRWAFHWDDLYVGERAREPDTPEPKYVAGFSKRGRKVVQHAVLPGTGKAVCSSPVRPLPFCRWSMPFAPNAPRACPRCVRLVGDS